jgi:hypothetical protein
MSYTVLQDQPKFIILEIGSFLRAAMRKLEIAGNCDNFGLCDRVSEDFPLEKIHLFGVVCAGLVNLVSS